MNPLRLYIQDFMCYKHSFINLEEIDTAIVVGRLNNSDLYSNAAGKSTIFKTIEYVLFNYAEDSLDKIIRDESDKCKITFDFVSNNVEYRVSRVRTKKGATDLSLFQRIGSSQASPHDENQVPTFNEKIWKDISGRRSSDTEKDLEKILKINLKLFRLFVHFVQNDFSGLTSSTPEKRKAILKEAFNLAIYSKLEKIAKEKGAEIFKEVEKKNIILNNLKENLVNEDKLNSDILQINDKLIENSKTIELRNNDLNSLILQMNTLSTSKIDLEKNFFALKQASSNVDVEINKILKYEEEQNQKKSSAAKSAKIIIEDIKNFNQVKNKLNDIDFGQISVLEKQIENLQNKKIEAEILLKNLKNENVKLSMPLPEENFCEHCRQVLTDEHRFECQEKSKDQISQNLLKIEELKSQIINNQKEIDSIKIIKNNLNKEKLALENANSNLIIKDSELVQRKNIYNEYSILLEKTRINLKDKQAEKDKINQDLDKSSAKEVLALDNKINDLKSAIQTDKATLHKIKESHSELLEKKAIAQHQLQNSIENQKKIEILNKEIAAQSELYNNYLLVIKGYSSTGIPNLIINGVLEELQIEANNLLNKLKPGLQLAFSLEKENADGEVKDTLDITYNINGRDRAFGQLSGAQQFVVNFSLKLGLSFLLQKMSGVDIKFLLLDEVDQSLDKASVDAFSDIVKFFKNDFKIIVITHNDRLKEKFNKAIVVNQNLDLISEAKLVSNW